MFNPSKSDVKCVCKSDAKNPCRWIHLFRGAERDDEIPASCVWCWQEEMKRRDEIEDLRVRVVDLLTFKRQKMDVDLYEFCTAEKYNLFLSKREKMNSLFHRRIVKALELDDIDELKRQKKELEDELLPK